MAAGSGAWLAVLVLTGLAVVAAPAPDPGLETIRTRMLAVMIPTRPIPEVDAEIAFLLDSQQKNGSWPDVDYNDFDGRSWWKTGLHLQRTLLLATGFRCKASAHYSRPEVAAAARLGLQYWAVQNFLNSNWWWNQIGTPRLVGKVCILLDIDSTDPLYRYVQVIFDRTSLHVVSTFTGCNKVWTASVNVMRALVEAGGQGNVTRLGQALQLAYSTLEVEGAQKSDGIQIDQSFHQHGPQLYSGWGYGGIFTSNVLLLEVYSGSTSFAMSEQQWDTFSTFLLTGQALATRGPNWDYSACGRLMTYFPNSNKFGVNEGHYHYFAAFTPFDLAFPEFREPFPTPLGVNFVSLLPLIENRSSATALHAFYDQLNGKAASTATLNRHYHDSDYMVHHRPSFMASVRMFSNRTINTECVNTENKQGRSLADGVTNVYISGREFEGVFPVWNWRLLPGVTAQQTGTFFNCGDVRDVKHTSWVGGVSDGLYGGAVFDFVRGHVTTHRVGKAWVLYDDAVLQLNAELTCNATAYHVTTGLDQRRLNTSVVYAGESGVQTLALNSTQRVDMQWVWHGGVAYTRLDGGEAAQPLTMSISNQNQTGSLFNITQGPPDPITMPVFTAYLDHGMLGGSDPVSFVYAAVPAASSDAVPALVSKLSGSITVLSNTKSLQAVCRSAGPQVMHAVFWPPPAFSSGYRAAIPIAAGQDTGCWDLASSEPALAVVRATAANTLHFAVSNPQVERRPLATTITISVPGLSGSSCASLNATHSTVAVTFPSGNLAGSSVFVTCTHA